MTEMDQRDLEAWAVMAAQELRELIDDAEESEAPEKRGDVALSTKALLADFDDIFNGRKPWVKRMASAEDDACPMSFLDA